MSQILETITELQKFLGRTGILRRAFLKLKMWALRDLWRRTVEDAGWKLKLYLAAFVLIVVPVALGDHLGLPVWITFPVFLTCFALLATVWLTLRMHDETAPWHLEQHIKRIGEEVTREQRTNSGLPPSPPVEVIDLTAMPTHVIATLGRLFGRFGRHYRDQPSHDRPPQPPAPPPVAVA